MKENRLLGAWVNRFARGALIEITVVVVVLCMVAVITAIALLAPVPDDQRLVLGAGCFTAFIIMGVLGIVTWGLSQRSRRATQFEAAFGQFGLAGRSYLTIGRQYHGALNGRQVDVYFNRGPQLDVYISAKCQTRLAIGRKDQVGSLVRNLARAQNTTLADPDFAAYNLSAADDGWARALLAEPAARSAVLRLLAADPAAPNELRTLIVQPDGVHLASRYLAVPSITPENARLWLYGLLEIAQAAERLPVPSQLLQASKLEYNNRSNRDAFIWPAILIVSGILLGAVLCMLIPIFLLLLSEGVFK